MRWRHTGLLMAPQNGWWPSVMLSTVFREQWSQFWRLDTLNYKCFILHANFPIEILFHVCTVSTFLEMMWWRIWMFMCLLTSSGRVTMLKLLGGSFRSSAVFPPPCETFPWKIVGMLSLPIIVSHRRYCILRFIYTSELHQSTVRYVMYHADGPVCALHRLAQLHIWCKLFKCMGEPG